MKLFQTVLQNSCRDLRVIFIRFYKETAVAGKEFNEK